MSQIAIPAVYMRGGTSKGLFLRERDLPADPTSRDRLLLAALGSPDPSGGQLDGLGCGSSSTSKVALIGAPPGPGFDLSYRFGAVDPRRPLIDWSGNCGNLSAAVGLYALEQGLVPVLEGLTPVRVWQANLGRALEVRVPSGDGRPRLEGDFAMAGVPGRGARIDVAFLAPGGGPHGEVLPTGNPLDRLPLPGLGEVEVTLVDAGNPTVLAAAADLGLSGTETVPRVNGDPLLLERLETLRCLGAVAMGLATDAQRIRQERPATPKIALLAAAADNPSSDGSLVPAADLDLLGRILSMGRLHHAFTGTGAIAVAVAARIPGTVAARCLGQPATAGRPLRLGHPAGVLEVGAEVAHGEHGWVARGGILPRSARTLMRGEVLVPAWAAREPAR